MSEYRYNDPGAPEGAYSNVMIDLESFGTDVTSAVVALGAVEFDLTAGTLGAEFYQTASLIDNVNNHRTVDPATVLWWMKQSDETRREVTRPDGPLALLLVKFQQYLEGINIRPLIRIWGNSPAFDNAMMSHCYATFKMEQPWEWWNDRDFRTFAWIYRSIDRERPPEGQAHNALVDAKYQAMHLITIKRVLAERKKAAK